MKNEASGHRVAWLGRENGLTLMEMIMTAVIIGAVTYAAVRLGTSITNFVQRTPPRQHAQMEMNACMDTMDRVLSNGKSSTLNIATPPTTPTLQYSSATFQSKDGATYTIYWSNSRSE